MSGRLPSRGSDQFNLRLPDGMRDEIAKAASENGRSMNAEIVARLERTFYGPKADEKMIEAGDLGIMRKMHDDTREALREMVATSAVIIEHAKLVLANAKIEPPPSPPTQTDTKREGEG